MDLYAPIEYHCLSEEAKEEVCNGCGSSKAKFDFVPDRIYGLCIKEACHIHDYMYHVGVSLRDKEEADRVLLNNLCRLIDDHGGILKIPRRWRAKSYYKAVKYFGGPAFWNSKNKS